MYLRCMFAQLVNNQVYIYDPSDPGKHSLCKIHSYFVPVSNLRLKLYLAQDII